MIVIANYFFDSLPHDEFLLQDHRLQECFVQLMRRPGPGFLTSMTWVTTGVTSPTTYHHYPHLAWNRILRDYRAEAPRGAFLFPRTALEILGQWSGKEFALLSSDGAPTTLESMVLLSEHPYTVHAGAFSGRSPRHRPLVPQRRRPCLAHQQRRIQRAPDRLLPIAGHGFGALRRTQLRF